MRELSIRDEETRRLLARALLDHMKKTHKNVILLSGDLGAGKTTFTQSLARELGVTDSIISPTFIIERQYDVKSDDRDAWDTLVHIDAYRFDTPQESFILNLDERATKEKNIIVIEWPEKISPLSRDTGTISVSFEHVSETERRMIVPDDVPIPGVVQ